MTQPESNFISHSAARWRAAAVIALFFVAAFLRFYRIGSFSIWDDEFASLQVASGYPISRFVCPSGEILYPAPQVTSIKPGSSIRDVVESLYEDTHPPLYPIMLRTWRTWLGESDAAARSLSALASLFAVMLLYDSVRLQFGFAPAFWAAAIMAVAVPQIQYAQEARDYPLLLMWTSAAANAVVRLEVLGLSRRRLIALALTVFAAMVTHYYGLAPVAAIAAYALLQLRGRQRRITLAAMGAGLFLAGMVLVPLFSVQRHHFVYMDWISDTPDHLWFKTFIRFCKLPFRWFFDPLDQPNWMIASALLYLVPLFVIRRRPAILLWWLLAVFAAGLTAAADLRSVSRSLTVIRYTIAGSVGFYVLLAVICADRRGRLGQALAALAFVAMLLSVPIAYSRTWKLDWRSDAQTMNERWKPSDLLVFYRPASKSWHQSLTFASIVHYSNSPRRLLILTGPPSPSLIEQIVASGRCWFFWDEEKIDPASLIPFPMVKEEFDAASSYRGALVTFSPATARQ